LRRFDFRVRDLVGAIESAVEPIVGAKIYVRGSRVLGHIRTHEVVEPAQPIHVLVSVAIFISCPFDEVLDAMDVTFAMRGW